MTCSYHESPPTEAGASIFICRLGNALDICLNTQSSYYGEWIAGEGADISLHRDQETKKVVGARLPLYAAKVHVGTTNGEAVTIDVASGEVKLPLDTQIKLAFAEMELAKTSKAPCNLVAAMYFLAHEEFLSGTRTAALLAKLREVTGRLKQT